MKLIITTIIYLASQNTYQYKVIDVETKTEGVYFSPQKFNQKDTINVKVN